MKYSDTLSIQNSMAFVCFAATNTIIERYIKIKTPKQ